MENEVLYLLLENGTLEQTERFYQFHKLGLVEMMRRMQAQRLGFRIVRENEDEYIMICKL